MSRTPPTRRRDARTVELVRRAGPLPVVPSGAAAFPAALLTWRAQAGLSRLAASRLLGVAHTTLRGWELSGVRPQPVNLPRLAAVLHLDLEELRALAGPDRVRTVRTSGGVAASPLCQARLAAGLTMTQVAIKVRVAPSTVSRWENGVRTPAAAMWPRLSAALRLDPALRDVVLAANRPGRSHGPLLPGLGQLRRDQGLTQRAFHTTLGIGATAATSWEHGRVRVPLDRLDDVADVLGVGRDALMARASEHPASRRQRPLADLRRAAGLTQRELALHLGVSHRTVARWEAGTRPPPRSAGRPLARILRQPLPRVLAAAGLESVEVPSPRTWRVERLPQVLHDLRRSSGWSAAALGRRVGVSGRTVRSWETGSTLPSPAACQRLELVHALPRGSLTSLRPGPPVGEPGTRVSPVPSPRTARSHTAERLPKAPTTQQPALEESAC